MLSIPPNFAQVYLVDGRVGSTDGWSIKVMETQQHQMLAHTMWIFDHSETENSGLREQVTLTEPVSGPIVILDTATAGIAFRHWLIVSLFIAFNIALHFIYRKRPEDKPCEV